MNRGQNGGILNVAGRFQTKKYRFCEWLVNVLRRPMNITKALMCDLLYQTAHHQAHLWTTSAFLTRFAPDSRKTRWTLFVKNEEYRLNGVAHTQQLLCWCPFWEMHSQWLLNAPFRQGSLLDPQGHLHPIKSPAASARLSLTHKSSNKWR